MEVNQLYLSSKIRMNLKWAFTSSIIHYNAVCEEHGGVKNM